MALVYRIGADEAQTCGDRLVLAHGSVEFRRVGPGRDQIGTPLSSEPGPKMGPEFGAAIPMLGQAALRGRKTTKTT